MKIKDEQFNELVCDIKQKIRNAQYHALQSVNKELILLYWSIGQSIVVKQEQFGWGKSTVKLP